MLYWEVYSQLGLYRPRVVLTIHNLDNTGECRQDEFSYSGVFRPCLMGVVLLLLARPDVQCAAVPHSQSTVW
jgi:hypothetical protein